WKSPTARTLLKPSRKSPRIAAEERRRNLLILRMTLVRNRDGDSCKVYGHPTPDDGFYDLLIFRYARQRIQMKAELVRVEQTPATIPFLNRIGHLVRDRVSFDFRTVKVLQFLLRHAGLCDLKRCHVVEVVFLRRHYRPNHRPVPEGT